MNAFDSRSELDGASIATRLDTLGEVSDDPSCLTRLSLSRSHRQAVDMVAGWMRSAGMTTRLDATGTLVGRYEAVRRGAPVLLMGSHIDTVRNAGKYDGNLGVVTAIAAVDTLNRLGRRLPFAIEILAFGDEEGVRFPTTLTGSRAAAGTFDAAALASRDADGISRREALAAFVADAGTDPDAWAREARDPATTLGYVEVHIEQGPVLEARGLPLGIVTAINGATRGNISIRGEAGHSGTLPMDMRRDALAAAADIILAIERIGRSQPDLVATVGVIQVLNGAVNIVPGAVSMSLDVRSPSDDARIKAVAEIEAAIADIAAQRDVDAAFRASHEMPAAPCDPALVAALETSFRRCGQEPVQLPSGAGHDAMAFRGRIPIAMVFVRCRGGISHNPREYASPADIGAGAAVLFDFLTNRGAGA